jgi:ADP-ribosylglycohydrolase
MINTHARCDGAFIGLAIASSYDPSVSMAVEISESLLEKKQFDGPDILSRYLFLYHTQQCEIGATTKYLYQIALNSTQSRGVKSSISRQDLLFNQSNINEFVKSTDNKLGGNTAGCGPAQRSFPLALCPWINDYELFQASMNEAALTHFNPLAGQVAGIVNLICRSLLRNKPWHEAVQSAFTEVNLHADVFAVVTRYSRSPDPFPKTDMAYAPTALNAALNYISHSDSSLEATEKAWGRDRYYCAPIVGILSGVRWGIPLDMYTKQGNDAQFRAIQTAANKLSDQWPSQPDNAVG